MGIKRTQRRYSGEFKRLVVEAIHQEHLSFHEAARRFNISSHKVIKNWERIYLEEGPEALLQERRGKWPRRKEAPIRQNVQEANRESLIAEVKWLRAENDYLKKLKALVLEEESRNKKRSSSQS